MDRNDLGVKFLMMLKFIAVEPIVASSDIALDFNLES